MSEIERPDWAYDGAEVYRLRNRNDDVQKRTVLRQTPTQLVVLARDGEERYYLKDLKRVGDYDYELVAPDHPKVHQARRKRESSEAVRDLHDVLHGLQQGAQLWQTRDVDVLLENTRRIRDAAVQAVERLEQID